MSEDLLEDIGEEETLPRLSVSDLKQAIPFAEKSVPIPELGGTVLVRSLSAHKRSKMINGLTDAEGNIKSVPEVQARMFAASVVDPAVTVEEARELAHTWPAPVWDRVTSAVDKLSPKPQEVRSSAEREFPDPDE